MLASVQHGARVLCRHSGCPLHKIVSIHRLHNEQLQTDYWETRRSILKQVRVFPLLANPLAAQPARSWAICCLLACVCSARAQAAPSRLTRTSIQVCSMLAVWFASALAMARWRVCVVYAAARDKHLVRYLFHGSLPERIEGIAKDGFSLKVSVLA